MLKLNFKENRPEGKIKYVLNGEIILEIKNYDMIPDEMTYLVIGSEKYRINKSIYYPITDEWIVELAGLV